MNLETVQITYRQKSTRISAIDPIKLETIGERELLKAACCNLSESFETNPSVDVSFADAVTGTRQIQMLGLSGPYIQVTRENIPDVRGLAAIYGFTFTPGTWIKSIQLNKGTGSVVNGFESIAGQINVELQKPQNSDKLNLNFYGNQGGRFEGNLHTAFKVSPSWHTGILLHGNYNVLKNDYNGDGFLDMPTGPHVIAMNRWKYTGVDGLSSQIGLKGTYIDQIGGQIDFDRKKHAGTDEVWGMNLNIKRVDVFAKLGKVWRDRPWRSVGSQYGFIYHQQESYFGSQIYYGNQAGAYANAIYQTIIDNTDHGIKTGASFMFDKYDEKYNVLFYHRTEIVPGAFFEYSYKYLDKLDIVAGVRADYHNIFGFFATPRLHIRYAPAEKTVIRLSGGRGQRTANIYAENNALFASSREIQIQNVSPEDINNNLPYGLKAEVAWNYGINITQYFTLDYREGSVSADFYRTDFQNQIVLDLDQNPQIAAFYNLDGKSYSNSFQIQADYEVIKRLDARIAYRWFDVKTTYSGELRDKPFVAGHRAFINLGYETRNHWKFDWTLNWVGEKRIPDTDQNPEVFQMPTSSPSYFMMNAQISKVWFETLEIYVGGENLLNTRQLNPIISSNVPFGNYFDSSLIWGPIFGRNIYAGIRWKILK